MEQVICHRKRRRFLRPQKTMYCELPTRLRHKAEKVRWLARKHGFIPVIPFDLGSFDDFEGNPRFGRERALAFGLKLQSACDTVGVFGISEGVMLELRDALAANKEAYAFPGLDHEWDKYYGELSPRYGDLFAKLRGKNVFYIFVGARASGKTYWIEKLLRLSPSRKLRLSRVRNVSTRPPREPSDVSAYELITREDFEERIATGEFLEHDEYFGNLYGSSWKNIRETLARGHGIAAMTPSGATAIHNHSLEVNSHIILLRPKSDDVLIKNLLRRGVSDPAEHRACIENAKLFTLPPEVPHESVEVFGEAELDEPAILGALSSARV